MRILFTSETTTGQIYMPRINWLLFAAVVVVTIIFGSSANLANAYGISVSAALVVDSLLAIVVMRYCWHWRHPAASCAVIGPFLLLEIAFVSSNSLKIAERRLGADRCSAASSSRRC